MLIASDSEFVAALTEARLLDQNQLDELTRAPQERFPDPREFAGNLVLKGWLTAYQANQLLQGKAGQLRLGPYRILDKLGAGGMGQVFKARHDRLRRTVALKLISNEHAANERMLERFRREAQAAAQLTHPNIVTVYDAGQVGDTHFLAMEFIDGVDLGRLVEETGRLPVAQACDYIRQAALGLQHAHERGLVHRDVKPANLLVKVPDRNGRAAGPQNLLGPRGAASLFESGTVKLLDLGMARLQWSMLKGKDGQITREGVLVGTLDYVAPEQGRDSHRVDHRADLYSLGCTLYHLLAGRAPFAEFEGIEKLVQHISTPPPDARAARPDVPEALAALVARLLAKRPEDRYQAAAEVAEGLAAFVGPAIGVDSGAIPLASRPELPPTREMANGAPGPPADQTPSPDASATECISLAPPPAQRRPMPALLRRRVLVPVVLALAVATLALASFNHGQPAPAPNRDAALPACLPADTAIVVNVNVGAWRIAPIVQKLEDAGAIEHLIGNRRQPGFVGLLWKPAAQDVEQIRAIYAAGKLDRPLYEARGRFDADSPALAGAQAQPVGADQFPGFAFYRTKAATLHTNLATDGRTLLGCKDADPIGDLLRAALARRQPDFVEEGFGDWLEKVDQQQAVWFVAAMTPFRGLKPSIDVHLAQALEPFFTHAQFVTGGIQLQDDAKAVIHVRTANDTNANRFAEKINELQRRARSAAEQARTPKELRPLVRCVADMEVRPDGRDFTLKLHLTADMTK